MRARFTDSIASADGWSYGAGTEVLVAGDRYRPDAVPDAAGRQWLASGLLEPISAPIETATTPPPTHASNPPVNPRREQRPSQRR